MSHQGQHPSLNLGTSLRVTNAVLAIAILVTLTVALTGSAQAQTYTERVLHSFGRAPDGQFPMAGLVQDAQGNLYGTTAGGGAGYGTVFKVDTSGNETVFYTFPVTDVDGAQPQAGLVLDEQGNLYGTTLSGGAYYMYGTAFKLDTAGNETVLHSFGRPGSDDGANPMAGVVQDAQGNLYGTTVNGGQCCGTVFKIDTTGNEGVLHNFTGGWGGGDGELPEAGLVQDAQGNLYGTTYYGGDHTCNASWGCGTVFKVDTAGTETVLHSFTGGEGDGALPTAGLVLDAQGNLYGTTYYGGVNWCGVPNAPYGCGTVFKLDKTGNETLLHSFGPPGGSDGSFPAAGLVLDAQGNLYGTTYEGGTYSYYGTVFKLDTTGKETLLHSFGATGDGARPEAGLVLDAQGNLYGTTYEGGAYGLGVVFELSPQLVRTTTVLVAAPNPSNPGQPVTLTATVTAQNGSTPTGTVMFESNGIEIGSASLNTSGVAVLSYGGWSLGTYSLTAVYEGSATLAGSTSNTVMQVVGATMTSVTSTPNPSTVEQEVTITATVSPGEPGGLLPTGTVSFTSNGTAISGCTDLPLTQSLTAVCMTSALPVGTDAIVATYSGDGNYLPSNGMLSQIVNPVPTPVQFVPLTPCRVVDTRNADGTFGGPAITGNSSRNFPLSLSGNPCGIPSTAVAYSLNVTVVPETALGYLTIWPSGEGQPIVSTLNSPDGRVKANAAIVPAGMPSGSVSVYVTNTTNVILDIDGYFATPTQGSLQFYTLTPCRIVDTRNGQDQGTLQAGVERDYTIAGQCGIPSDAAAYSFNVTVLPAAGGLDYLTLWPEGESRPTVSTLNDNTGTVVANAAIVPAGSENATAFYAHSNNTNLLLDVDGYFAAPGAGGLSMYPLTPCRVLDTRHSGGSFVGEKTVNVVGSFCAPPSSAEAYIFNATVVPPGPMLYLTLWPNGEQQPTVSTLNAEDGFITSNMAIVPTNNGSIDAYAAALTQLILDISGYFAP